MDRVPDIRLDPPEVKAVLNCDLCGDEIFEGDYYYDLNGEVICENCVESARKVAGVNYDAF